MSKEEIKVGDYVKKVDGVFHDSVGLVINSIENGLMTLDIIDEDGDNTTWSKRNVELLDKEVVNKKMIIIPEISENYNAVINFDKKAVMVGCQNIPFEKVEEIFSKIKSKNE